MKVLRLLFLFAFAGSFLPGCKVMTHDPKGIADSLNKSKERTATSGITVNIHDAKFATDAAVDGMYSVGLSKLALVRSKNPKVKKVANTIVADYAKSNNELMHTSKVKNVTLPYAPDTEHQDKMDNLGKTSDANFDLVYISMMIVDQKKTFRLMISESKDGSDPDLRSYAVKTGSLTQLHLTDLHKVHDGL